MKNKNVYIIAGQDMGLIPGRTYLVNLIVNKTDVNAFSQMRMSTSSVALTEGVNGTIISPINPPNGLSLYSGEITADGPMLVFASDGKTWSGSILSVSVQEAAVDTAADMWLNEDQLLAFVGTGDARVAKIYDQSGNARDYAQTTATKQPLLVSQGIVQSMGDMPAPKFTGVEYMVGPSASFLNNTPYTINAVVVQQQTVNAMYALSTMSYPNGLDQNLHFGRRGWIGMTLAQYFDDANFQIPALNNNAPHIITGINFGGAITGFSGDGVFYSSNYPANYLNSSTTVLGLGCGVVDGGGDCWIGNIAEAMMFKAGLYDQDRLYIERDQGAAFGITVP